LGRRRRNIFKAKKEIKKDGIKYLYELMQEGINKLMNKNVNEHTNKKERDMDFSNQ